MSRLLWLWVLLLIGSLILGPWWYQNTFCPCTSTASGQSEDVQANIPATPAPETTQSSEAEEPEGVYRFALRDGNDFSVGSPEHFTFPRSSSLPNIPTAMETALQKIATYLKANPDRALTLTGKYAAAEENDKDTENLGISRALAIKDRLLSLGIPESSIQSRFSLRDDLKFVDGIMEGGVGFEIGRKADDGAEIDAAKALEELKAAIVGKPLIVYFETSSSDIIRTDEQETFLRQAKKYLEAVPTAKIAVTGHTDSRGNPANNMTLSQNRANSTKAWLVKSGFDAAKISSIGKGESAPAFSNDTDNGRLRNRRAEILIIE
ncbi:MAG: OmpA family protein [Bacteroidota bacterium]